MKVYLIVKVYSSGQQFVSGVCFDSKENVEKYCEDYNNDTYDYLEYCRINCIFSGDFSLFEVREIEVIEDAY